MGLEMGGIDGRAVVVPENKQRLCLHFCSLSLPTRLWKGEGIIKGYETAFLGREVIINGSAVEVEEVRGTVDGVQGLRF